MTELLDVSDKCHEENCKKGRVCLSGTELGKERDERYVDLGSASQREDFSIWTVFIALVWKGGWGREKGKIQKLQWANTKACLGLGQVLLAQNFTSEGCFSCPLT